MQELIGITVVLVTLLAGIFVAWSVFCLILKGMFKIADKIFGW